jgi:hypothetical protein
MTTDDARQVLHDLETKLAAALARAEDLDAAARGVAYVAHVDGGEARKRLDKIDADRVKCIAEIASLDAAIGEAKRRVREAEAANADDVARDKAHSALALLEDFTKRGRELDEALGAFLAKYEALTSDFHKLDALGYAPTTHALVKANMSAAVSTALQFTELRQAFLAPHERRTFVAVIEGWGRNVRMRATARLNAKTAAKAA